MRAIKSVLVMAGPKKIQVMFQYVFRVILNAFYWYCCGTVCPQKIHEGACSYIFSKYGGQKELTSEEETCILIHCLRDANLPKFLAEDVPLFESIMADLFPGTDPPEQDDSLLKVRQQRLSQYQRGSSLCSSIVFLHSFMFFANGTN